MGSGAKTPGRLKAGAQEEGGAAAARSGAAAKPEATVDIGALLRNKRSGLLGTSGGFGSLGGASRPAAPAGGAPAPLAASFGGGRGLDVVTAENPIYSPDDSLARAASKLQNLKAPQPRAPSRAAQAQAAIAAAAAPLPLAAPKPDASPEPAPERCESPQLIPAFPAAAAGEQQAPPPAGEGSHKGLSGEDSGELAALSALQKRRKSLAPATAAKQRYGEWFDGSDKDLEHTLQEYNKEAPAPSPRMTRAQRRKSLAVDQSLALEPGLARSLLDRSLAAEEEEQEGAAGNGQAQQQQQEPQQAVAGQVQQAKRAAAGRRKSVAATQQVQVALPAERPGQHGHHASVADEVAALNAEMCAALSGLVGEESPEKGHRGDQRPLREKLLESWDGKTYYERLLAMQEAEQEQQQADKQQASAALAGQDSGSQAELGAVQQRLGAAMAEQESLAEQLRQAQEELAAERAGRAAEQQELEQLRAKRKEEAAALKVAEQRAKQLAREVQDAQAAAAAHVKTAAELEARWAEAEKALGAVLKAANGALKAVAAGKEEARSLGEALRSCAGGAENAAAAPAASSGRSRQSTGRQWR
ncbi:hypothetical protein C2E21_3031 [Chlorella sorokiniana]|uniref:Uncharacterized protein n=1 Tax=Chlorella sorokiniana TaxID=3076 RepID=A0A2P6TWL7_CHLSO|nr:hypothetical protein C2E21_3031 [Chlorella sorokiniana]|eukprot:PRW58458.1 hypothetical protein C2E21_3031 [Chlorella sorokiniana]